METLSQQIPIIENEEVFPLSEQGYFVSEEEYWEKYYGMSDRAYEWNNGILEEKPMGDYLSFLMYRWFCSLLEEYLANCPVGRLVGLEIGFRLAIPGKTSVRKPDLAIVLNDNPVPVDLYDRSYKGIFDMCFEFLSDSDPGEAERDTVTKKSEYCRSGVKEYFILDRKGAETAFYRLYHRGSYSEIRPVSGDVICSAVLPGFQFRIRDLYCRPSIVGLSDDPVYSEFVSREYQEIRLLAEKERQRAEEAEQRAERLAARLRELGIEDI